MDVDREQISAALPNYEIGAELGRGGWGVVLEGRHRQLGRNVAIKQLPGAFAADPAVRARFIAEARALAALDHPHVVPIYDYVESGDLCLLVMENLTGGTVWGRFTTSGLTLPAVCAIGMATCAGLHCAHQSGILHRDVKPENLLFNSSSTLKVTDFGIAKMMAGAETKATRAGEVLGTPAYMAPEQVRNGELTPATDVYAVGTMLYELLSGRLPFTEEDPMALLFCQVNDDPPHLSEVAPNVPPKLAEVTMRAMSKDPADRYATSEDFGVALADAATESWEPGWLQQADLPVMSTARMSAVTQDHGRGEPERVTPASRTGPAPATRMASGSSAPRRTVAAPSTVVRAHAPTGHVKGAVATDIGQSDLVAINEVVKIPGFPTQQVLIAVGLLVLSVAIAFVGLGSPSLKKGTIPPGAITVAGADPTGKGVVTLDLSQPVTVAGALPAASAADKVTLSFLTGGLLIGRAQQSVTPGAGGSFTAAIDLSSWKYVIAGKATAEVSLEGSGKKLATTQFKAKSKQASVVSVPGAIAIAALLFAIAYAESILRALRRRRKKVTGPIGLVLIGALTGVIAVVWAWLLASVEPTIPTMVVCGVLGGVAGLFAGLAGIQMGRWRRQRRIAAARAR